MDNLQNKTINDCQNFYELRKTIRFILKPEKIDLRSYKPMVNSGDLRAQIEKFINKYNLVIQSFENLIYFTLKNSEGKKLNKKIFIKHSWLRNYTKTDYFDAEGRIIQYDKDNKKRSNKITINDVKVRFLNGYFQDWIKENQECIDNLKNCLNQPENNQKRTSEFAYWVTKITKRSNFEFIFELFNDNIEHKNSNDNINDIKKLLDECKLLLIFLEKELLPHQSLGIGIERASFNYYTVNKKPKNYPRDIKDKEKESQQDYLFSEKEQNLFSQAGFMDVGLPISDLKEAMKKFKAEQKSKFYEFVNQGKTYRGLKIEHGLRLLNDISEKEFNKFKDAKGKAEKGKHFQFSFPRYKNFCNAYKNVAVELGKIKADIKSLEKEKIDAEKLQSWAVILEKDNQKYILTIPRNANNNIQNARKYIDNLQSNGGIEWKLHTFESLTLKALDKLCFGLDKNTFIPKITAELQQINSSCFIAGKLKRKDQFSEDGTELLKFYQTVLGLDITKTILAIDHFKNFDAFVSKKYENQADFEKALKQTCYYKKSIFISEDEKDKIVGNYNGNLYKVTSYDLEKNDAEILNLLENKKRLDRNNPEYHTRVWLDFWTNKNIENNYEIRLNPEFKINFVEKQIDRLADRNLGKLKKNRSLNNRYLLSTTITMQAHEKNVDLSYKTTNCIKEYVEKYNKEFNLKIKPFDIYYYGLDRGQKELLTLGLFKFSEIEKMEFINQDGIKGNYNKPEFIDLEAYRLKKEKYLEKNNKGRTAYKSADQFVDSFEIMEKISIKSCLDLSCAKLVRGKLVVNGDISSYLELKRISALRKIWEGTVRNKFKLENIGFDAGKGIFFLEIENRGKIENESLYFFDERFDNILSSAEIKYELQECYDKIKKDNGKGEYVSIDKINHLRDALCANAVGIINYLEQKYFGVVVFEDLNIDNKNKRISEFAGNLASRIEWKLLQKFQTFSIVPPNLKQIMSLQNNKKINQIGAMLYIETSGTSNECPHCGTKNTDKSQKWNAHAYECKNSFCKFDTKTENKRNGLIALDNSDKVAAYNIAKKGLEQLQR